MTIVNFTPWSALLGGMLIGLAAALLMLLNGRVAGISGIVGGALKAEPADRWWRLVFVAGLIIGGLLYQWLGVGIGVEHIQAVVDKPLLVIAGLLVGIGTTVGNGCTSGHGICGLARGSQRSLVATLSFMGAAFVTVFIVRHLPGAGS